MTVKRERADKVLLQRGLFDSRARARQAIEAHHVTLNGQPLTKSSQMIPVDAVIEAQAAHPYVSRGGLKLAHALEVFAIDPAGRACLDIGASTGGFSDVLLKSGAYSVTCVDVGRDQLHADISAHPRVTVFEGLDSRQISPGHLLENLSLIVADLSFIALEKALGNILTLAPEHADFIGLFKPQFQVGKAHIGRKGIVRDKDITEQCFARFQDWMSAQYWPVLATVQSPIQGGSGNTEWLWHARKG